MPLWQADFPACWVLTVKGFLILALQKLFLHLSYFNSKDITFNTHLCKINNWLSHLAKACGHQDRQTEINDHQMKETYTKEGVESGFCLITACYNFFRLLKIIYKIRVIFGKVLCLKKETRKQQKPNIFIHHHCIATFIAAITTVTDITTSLRVAEATCFHCIMILRFK